MKKNILLIDDRFFNRDIIQEIFASQADFDYNIQEAINGVDAFNCIEGNGVNPRKIYETILLHENFIGKTNIINNIHNNNFNNFIYEGYQEIYDNSHRNGEFIPDIILLDLNMPEMDGYEFLRKFKEFNGRFKHTKIIVVSAYSSIQDYDKVIKLGAETFLDKANIVKQLIVTVKENLRKMYNSNYIESK